MASRNIPRRGRLRKSPYRRSTTDSDYIDPDLWSVFQFITGVAGLLYPPVRDWVRSRSAPRQQKDPPKEIIDDARNELREDVKNLQQATRLLRAFIRDNGLDEKSPFELDGVSLELEYFSIRPFRKMVKSVLSLGDKTLDDSLEVEAYLHHGPRHERPGRDEARLKELIHELRNAKTFSQAFDLADEVCALVYELLASSRRE